VPDGNVSLAPPQIADFIRGDHFNLDPGSHFAQALQNSGQPIGRGYEKSETMPKMTTSARADWLVPTLLIALSFIPVAAGAARLFWLASGVEITPGNTRFFAAPLPVVLHILSVTLFCILGAFQFSAGFVVGGPAGTAPPGGSWSSLCGNALIW